MKTKGKTWSHGSNSCLSFVVCRLSFVVWCKGGCCAELLDMLQTDRNISSRFFAMVAVNLKHYQYLVNQPID